MVLWAACRFIYGMEVEASYVTYVVAFYEALSCIVLIGASVWLTLRVEQKASEIDDDSSTPADFTVFVRNLPKDVSEGALVAHFSMRYALEYEQPEFPVFGYSQWGACLTVGLVPGVFFAGTAAGIVTPIFEALGFGFLGPIASILPLLFFWALFTGVLFGCGYGRERDRLTPAQRWDEKEAEREAHRAKVQAERDAETAEAEAEAAEKAAEKARVRAGQIAPEPNEDDESGDEGDGGGGDGAAPRAPRRGILCRVCCCCCCCCKKNKVAPGGEEDEEDAVDEFGLSPATDRPDPKPVQSSLHNGFPSVLGSWVADLHIVYPNAKIISLYASQRALISKVEDMRSQIQMYKEDTPYKDGAGADPDKVVKKTAKLDKLMKKMNKAKRKVAKMVKDSRKAANCEGCFITFNHEESQQRCLEDYRASSSALGRFFQPKHLRFMWHKEDPDTGDKVQTLSAIRVEQAPEPSDILWENLTLSDTERAVRLVASNLITFLVLLFSFVIAVLAAGQTSTAAADTASTNYCDDLPAVWYGRYYNKSAADAEPLWAKPVVWVRNASLDEEYCGNQPGRFYIVNSDFDLDPRHLPGLTAPSPFELGDLEGLGYRETFGRGTAGLEPEYLCDSVCHAGATLDAAGNVVPAKRYNGTLGCRALSCQPGLEGWEQLGQGACVGTGVGEKVETPAGESVYALAKFYTPASVANCYCAQQYSVGLNNGGNLLEKTPAPEDEELCSAYYQTLNSVFFYTTLSLVAVIVINGASKPLIKTCVGIEKRASVSEEKSALVAKMFSLQFINTAIITLVVNCFYQGSILSSELGLLGVGTGEYGNFNMQWYMNIGASLATTMYLQVYTPHQGVLQGIYAVKPLTRMLTWKSASTQQKLDEMYEGDEFMIEARSGFIGVSLMVTLMYSTGIPIMTFFGFLNFAAAYCVDKYLLIKRYKQPPMYGPAVPKVLVNLLPLGTFLHMAIGIYMLSNENLFYGPDIDETISSEAESVDDEEQEFLAMVFPKVVRAHTLILFFIFAGYCVLFVFYLMGQLDEFAEGVINWQGRVYATLFGNAQSRAVAEAKSLDHEEEPRPAFCDPYVAPMTSGQKAWFKSTKKLSAADKKRGFRLAAADGSAVTKIHTRDTEVNGQPRAKGTVKYTWEHIKDATIYTYDIGLSREPRYKAALVGIKANGLPCPSRKMRIEEEDDDDLYGQTLAVADDAEAPASDDAETAPGEQGADLGLAMDAAAAEPLPPVEDPAPAEPPTEEAAAEELAVATAEPPTASSGEATGEAAAEAPPSEDAAPREPTEEEQAAAAAEAEAKTKADADEAERQRAEAEAKAKFDAEEAERQRIEDEASSKAAAEEAERQRVEAEAQAKAAAEEAERQRADEEARAKAAEEADFARQKAEAKAAAEARAEAEAAEAERLRLEAEAAENMEIVEDEDAEEL